MNHPWNAKGSLVPIVLLLATPLVSAGDAENTARTILDKSNVRGGIVVLLGCEPTDLAVALHANERYLVHALTNDPQRVTQTRARIDAAQLAGPVSVELFETTTLPYVDNLINLVVVADADGVTNDEIMRVLAPNGVACFRNGDQWTCKVKRRPESIDQWTHYLHDAGNNAVADDTTVGPPRSLQWGAPPLWLRSHETPSGILSPVSAGGRLFYFLDEGPIGITDPRIPSKWALVGRDAFNGKLLWKRPLGMWGWRAWSLAKYKDKDWTRLRARRTDVPAELQHRVVALGDRLFVTLSYKAPMSILDASSGEVLHTVAETAPAREILVSDGVALTYSQETSPEDARRRGQEQRETARLVAVDADSGKVLWQKPCRTIRPQMLTINDGRIIFHAGTELVAIALRSGTPLWQTAVKRGNPKTLISVDGVAVVAGTKQLAAYDATSGALIWKKEGRAIGGAANGDLFVIDGLLWHGIRSVSNQPGGARKSPDAQVTGWDLHTGVQEKRILVKNLRSPEHHHRCYRNMVTTRYMISSMEGAEFLDLRGDRHSQNNWIRGACRSGMMPCNGMLYVPADQCFCEPGAKILGFTALTAQRDTKHQDAPDRLVHGPAYDAVATMIPAANDASDWPTLRHDPARSGSTTAAVPAAVSMRWQTRLTGPLTAPVVAAGKVFVAQKDAHRLIALNATTGQQLWQFAANGRIDSPPTIHQGLVLFGSCDGHVYCLRADDGALVWRFLAAPRDQRIAYFDQIESSWPVHGSVLVDQDVVYFTAGRSTYLDGGIRVYGLDPRSGTVRYKTVLEGPFPDRSKNREVSFYVLGANSDVLVSEGGSLYMRQKKLTRELVEVPIEVISSKGAQNVGLHVFSTSGLLDGSWYNRTFWMYSQRWPGFQLANQAPKSGQLLVVDDQQTYALRVFYRRNVHSPMFFPAREGYLLFADDNDNEPQIVGEPGARPPLRWLPQSDYSRARGDEIRKFESKAFGLDKMIGYTRAEPPRWSRWLAVRGRAMVKAGANIFIAGAPDQLDPKDPMAAIEGRRGAQLVTVSAADGTVRHAVSLATPPVFDGMIAAGDCLYATLIDGSVVCMSGE